MNPHEIYKFTNSQTNLQKSTFQNYLLRDNLLLPYIKRKTSTEGVVINERFVFFLNYLLRKYVKFPQINLFISWLIYEFVVVVHCFECWDII